jgi:hypothetical protein
MFIYFMQTPAASSIPNLRQKRHIPVAHSDQHAVTPCESHPFDNTKRFVFHLRVSFRYTAWLYPVPNLFLPYFNHFLASSAQNTVLHSITNATRS